jgi:hypothetical protein
MIFKTLPTACDRLAHAEAKQAGALATLLKSLGQPATALRVFGQVNAQGVVKYDTAAPEDVSMTWLSKDTCGLSIFGK